MNICVVYDDTVKKSEVISDVIGAKGFSEVVVKRQTLGERFQLQIQNMMPVTLLYTVESRYEFNDLKRELEGKLYKDIAVLHFFANYIIADEQLVSLTLKKILYVDELYIAVVGDMPVAILAPTIQVYITFLDMLIKEYDYLSVVAAKSITERMAIEGIVDIGKIENFIKCVTGNFEARYFNSLKGDEYTIVKTSTNKKKIKAEYTFWHILPEDMQVWFVEPFHYQENEQTASYTMERLHMTDLAIKWVHGSIDKEEFSVILDKYFYFFNHRHLKEVEPSEYEDISNELYKNKVIERIEDLKQLPEYKQISDLLALNHGLSIDDIVDRYLSLKDRLEKNTQFEYISVIGHGDPCFANTMYNKATRTLKFIDPKGALMEKDLWTNPYYDIAKLSHSICGRYDFFNNALFDIKINDKFETELYIDFDNSKYVALFKRKVEENGYNFNLVRLYEASLFISMLPLHIDNPHKVYGFILNAINILKEIEYNV